MAKFLVVSQAEYTEATGILETSEGEFGGEGYVEMKDQHELVLGIYNSDYSADAILACSKEYGISIEVLDAYKLAD